ncbi:MAG: LD-carboxypeptidase [Verrucomicrobiales bacterium]|nr:LD-carboxypeptidase [Verrucomicrobiales bacterium]
MSDGFQVARNIKVGSVLAVVAPSGAFNRELFDLGVQWLRERYEVRFDEGIYAQQGYFAGSDERRLQELQGAIADPEVDAILCARGGFGATRLLPDLQVEQVRQANKLLVGFSDVTALHALWARAGVRSMHAPMVSVLGKASEGVRQDWVATLEGTAGLRSWQGLRTVAGGRARGRLLGGNLSVLCAMLGTPYFPKLEGCVLFLEDVGERPYRVDRMLTAMTQAGVFDQCAALVLGAFTEGKAGADGVSVDEVLGERLGGLGIPVVADFPAGHVAENACLVFGAMASLDGVGGVELG